MNTAAALGTTALSLLCVVLCGSVAAARTPRAFDAARCSQRASPRSTAYAHPCVSQERDAGFESIGPVASRHGGIRTANVGGRTSWIFPSEALFRDESGTQPGADDSVFRAIVAEMRRHSTRRYAVIVYAAEDAGSGAVLATEARARSFVARLVGAGLARTRFEAHGAGTTSAEDVYDGPSTLAPGNALIEIALVPAPTDASCPP
jgi:hypothetical protein